MSKLKDWGANMDWNLIKQAWLAAADNWINCKVVVRGDDTGCYVRGADDSFGLCRFFDKYLGEHIKEKRFIQDRIDSANLTCDGLGYKWPLTKAGARQRAAFCRKEARINWEKIGKHWAKMSEEWKPENLGPANLQVVSGNGHFGLCTQIILSNLPKYAKDIMLGTVSSNGKYKWPLTKAGAKKRREFCREQAAKLGC